MILAQEIIHDIFVFEQTITQLFAMNTPNKQGTADNLLTLG